MRNGITIKGVEHELVIPSKKEIENLEEAEMAICKTKTGHCSLCRQCDWYNFTNELTALCRAVPSWQKLDNRAQLGCYFKKVKHD